MSAENWTGRPHGDHALIRRPRGGNGCGCDFTFAFSSADNPHYIILVGILAVSLFLLIEARRYRDYDVYRSRVRLFQQNLLADALDPSEGLEHEDWRSKLSQDYRRPTLKVSTWEATANRLRRIYLPLLIVLLVAWLFRITAFAPNESLLTTASIAVVPGPLVIAVIVLCITSP